MACDKFGKARKFGIGVVAWNVFDLLVHVAANMLTWQHGSANVIVMMVMIPLLLVGEPSRHAKPGVIGTSVCYLIFMVLFFLSKGFRAGATVFLFVSLSCSGAFLRTTLQQAAPESAVAPADGLVLAQAP